MIRTLRPVLCALACCLMLACVATPPAPAQAQTTPTAVQQLDGIRATLEQVEPTLTRQDLADAALQDLRSRLEPLGVTLQAALDDLTPRQDALRVRLEQLGPKPGDKAPPEAASVSAARDDLQRQFDDADAAVKRARLLSVRLDQASNAILTRRRELFTRTLLYRNYSLLSPELWIAVMRELPQDARAVSLLSADWWSATTSRLQGWQLTGFLGGLLAILFGFVLVRRFERRVVYRDPGNHDPTPFRKTAAALWVAIAIAAVPMIAMLAFADLLRGAGLSTPRLEPFLTSLVDGVARISITLAIASGLLAPGLPNWRLLDLRDTTVERLQRLAISVAIIVSVSKTLEAIVEIIAASLPISIALRGSASLLVALVIANGLHGIAGQPLDADEDACLGPQITPTPRDWYGPMRLVAWTTIVAIIGAVAIGYVAFGAFLVDQIVWVTFIGCSLHLLLEFIRQAIATGFEPQAPFGRGLVTSLGLRRESLDQLSVLLTGLVQVAFIVAAAMLALAPWGIESDDMFASVRAAFFGFKVGDVTISLSSIIVAILIFGLIWAVTRGLQRWLETKLLPRTQLDTGLSNSIKTSIGYVGVLIAATLSLGYLGLSFDKLAIVAGALSLGIGFGLQSIVGNFVSGLILLWERAIRVGDWVVVGDEQGFVRRINVRSTEIETFDRATMIVPNSNLVTGVVKNWVRNDRVGRIKIPVAFNMTADPEKVRDTLLACARAHDLVLKIPAPTVFFVAMADNVLKFELVCFIGDVETAARVKSDLNFAIFRSCKEVGLELVTQQAIPTTFTLAGFEKLATLIERAGQNTPRA